jgi:hypothetical protein
LVRRDPGDERRLLVAADGIDMPPEARVVQEEEKMANDDHDDHRDGDEPV